MVYQDMGLETGIPVSGIPGNLRLFSFPVSRFSEQNSRMLSICHQFENIA